MKLPIAFVFMISLVGLALGIPVDGTVTVSCNKDACPIVVSFFPLEFKNGVLQGLSKSRAQGYVDGPRPFRTIASKNSESVYQFSFDDLPPGSYAAMAQLEPENDESPYFFGFYKEWEELHCSYFEVCTTPIQVGDSPVESIHIEIPNLRLLPSSNFTVKLNDNSAASHSVRNGIHVLHLKGSDYERGYLHGKILAGPIFDLFTFFMLQDRVPSPQLYEKAFLPKLKQYTKPTKGFMNGIRGMLKGMNDSGICLFHPVLQRTLNEFDLIALNLYNEYHRLSGLSSSPQDEVSSCSQFIFSRELSLNGKTVTGRNMDGECDVRKLTVAHVVVFAEEPTDRSNKFVHVMWPGFIGVSSGLSERGIYMMENSGCSQGIVSDPFIPMRDVIRSSLLDQDGIRPLTPPQETGTYLKKTYGSPAGGICTSGCILLIGQPALNQSHFPGFVIEADRVGLEVRENSDTFGFPFVVGTNHFLKYYQSDPQSKCHNSHGIVFTSEWRYTVANNRLSALHRKRGKVGIQDAKELLKSATEGFTEYSVVTCPDDLYFEVSVASTQRPLWDAADGNWVGFHFHDLFHI